MYPFLIGDHYIGCLVWLVYKEVTELVLEMSIYYATDEWIIFQFTTYILSRMSHIFFLFKGIIKW